MTMLLSCLITPKMGYLNLWNDSWSTCLWSLTSKQPARCLEKVEVGLSGLVKRASLPPVQVLWLSLARVGTLAMWPRKNEFWGSMSLEFLERRGLCAVVLSDSFLWDLCVVRPVSSMKLSFKDSTLSTSLTSLSPSKDVFDVSSSSQRKEAFSNLLPYYHASKPYASNLFKLHETQLQMPYESRHFSTSSFPVAKRSTVS